MNQPTDEQIKEAMDRVNREIMVQEKFVEMLYAADSKHPHEQELEYLRTLRTALEQMNRTVSDTDVLADKVALAQLIAKDKLYHELIMAVETKYPNESRHATAWRYIREREERRDLGIEVEGEAPDDKFNNEKDQ